MPHVFYEDPTCVKFFDDFDINLYLDLYAQAYRPQAQGHEDLRAKRKRLHNAILAAKAAKLPTSREVQLGRYWERGELITVQGLWKMRT
ncbi:hypothetical protein ONZ45_g12173 [Pleurotus djamor]|nr:hypothetical protein ONZ45_g12173 [Pleurotus djamor]